MLFYVAVKCYLTPREVMILTTKFVFWDMMAFSLIEFTGSFGGRCFLRLQERRAYFFTTKYLGICDNAYFCPPTHLIFILHQSNI